MAGRPTTYTEEMAQLICEAVATSQWGLRKTLEKGEELVGQELPALSTVEGWSRDHALFSSQLAQAKMRQLHLMAEDIVDISRDDTLEPNDKRIRIDTLKWLLAKLIPKTYGDKLDLTSDGAALNGTAVNVDARVQSIIMQAKARRLGQQPLPALEPEALKLLD